MGNTIREKVALLRELASDPLAQQILAGEGSVFEEHAVPIEDNLLPGLIPELRTAATHVLTLSGLSAPGISPYAVTGAIQRFQTFVTINLATHKSGRIDWSLPKFTADSWQDFERAQGLASNEKIAETLKAGAGLADRVLAVYRDSNHRLGISTAPEIITLVGLHIYDLAHMILDSLIAMSRHNIAVHEAQDYFRETKWSHPAPVEAAEWPSYI